MKEGRKEFSKGLQMRQTSCKNATILVNKQYDKHIYTNTVTCGRKSINYTTIK
jgi:hypothetical protein